MAKKIKIDNFSKAIQETLSTYADEVIEGTKQAVDEVSKEALKIVKQYAPLDSRPTKRKGRYRRSLKIKTVYESITEKKNVIYAGNGEHRLTHLLENGHALSSGGRARAIPHFKYGDTFIKNEFPKRIKKRIGGK